MSLHETAGTDPTWAKLQDKLASLSTDIERIIVADGDHALQFFQPATVIESVAKMVESVRAKGVPGD